MSNELTDQEYNSRLKKTKDEFHSKHYDDIYNLHLNLQEYCYNNILDIATNSNIFGELLDLIIDETALVDNLLEKNLIEENKVIEHYDENNYETYQD